MDPALTEWFKVDRKDAGLRHGADDDSVTEEDSVTENDSNNEDVKDEPEMVDLEEWVEFKKDDASPEAAMSSKAAGKQPEVTSLHPFFFFFLTKALFRRRMWT